jgi:hypothetical protein
VAHGRPVDNSGEFIRIDRESGGHDGGSETVAQVHPQGDIYYPNNYQYSVEHESHRRHQSQRKITDDDIQWIGDISSALY